MGIAALVLWVLTAGGGFYMLAQWVGGGGHRSGSATRFPSALIFGHFLLAASGLVLWIIYLVVDKRSVGWVALILLALAAVGGLTMFARWVPTYRSRQRAPAPAGEQPAAASGDNPPERNFPVAIVGAHGVLAVTTLVLVILTMVGIGAS
jgi:manganese efflux pump family protein